MARRNREQNKINADGRWHYLITGWRPYAFLFILCALLFGRAVQYSYTNCDDDILILSNYQSIDEISDFAPAFHTPYLENYYRPVVTASLILDAQISHQELWMYHCSNLIFHAVAACLIFYLFAQLRFPRLTSFCVALIFLINPIVVQAVAWIPGRNDSLVTVFMLLSFLSLIRFIATDRVFSLGTHLFWFLLAVLTKESALIAAPLFLLYYSFVASQSLRSPATVQLIIGWLAAIVLWLVGRWWAFSGLDHPSTTYMISSLSDIVRSVVEQIGKMVIPVNMSVYPTFHTSPFVAGIAVILGIGILIWRLKAIRNRLIIVGGLWVLLFLITGAVVHVVDTVHRFQYLESRAYPALVGFSMIIIGIYQSLKPELRQWGNRLFVLAAVVYIAVVWMYTPKYRDPVSYWTNATETSPNAAEAYFNLGVVFHMVESNPGKAAVCYVKAITLDSTNGMYHDNLGFAWNQQGNITRAKEEFIKAIRCDSTDPFPRIHIASVYFMENNLAEAESSALVAVRLDSNSVDAISMLIEIYRMHQKYDLVRDYSERLSRVKNK